jgi:hypothetical protein
MVQVHVNQPIVEPIITPQPVQVQVNQPIMTGYGVDMQRSPYNEGIQMQMNQPGIQMTMTGFGMENNNQMGGMNVHVTQTHYETHQQHSESSGWSNNN